MRGFFEGAVHPSVIAQASFLDALGAFAHPLPWVLLVLAHILLEHNAQKELHRFEAGLVHLLGDRQHCADSHVERPQALVTVTDGCVNKSNLAHLTSNLREIGSTVRMFNDTPRGRRRCTDALILCINSYRI